MKYYAWRSFNIHVQLQLPLSTVCSFPLKNSLYCFELIQHCPHIPTFSCCKQPFIHTDDTEHHPSAARLNHWRCPPPDQRPLYHLFISANPDSADYKVLSPQLQHAATVWTGDGGHHADHRSSSGLSSRLGPCCANASGGPIWTQCWRWR